MRHACSGFCLDVSEPAPACDDQRQRFGELVLPEIDMLLRVARTIVPRPADAEDLVQDTLVRAFRSMHTFDGAHPRAWLLTILRNTQINRTRRRRPQLLDDQDAAYERLADDAGDASPESLVIGQQFDAAVADALDRLPEKLRTVVELVDVGGLAYQEAADVLDVPVGTIMSRLHRARRRIRDRLIAAGLAPGRST